MMEGYRTGVEAGDMEYALQADMHWCHWNQTSWLLPSKSFDINYHEFVLELKGADHEKISDEMNGAGH
jgi:hypothetical protein